MKDRIFEKFFLSGEETATSLILWILHEARWTLRAAAIEHESKQDLTTQGVT
jgi:hypothetical protein